MPIVSLVALVAAASLLLDRRAPPASPPGTGDATTIEPSPIDTATAYSALVEGTQLSAEGHYLASLPRFRTALRGLPGTWEAHFNLASSLENAALESNPRMGRLMPALRSSVERIAAITEAGRERDVALAVAGDGHRRAWTLYAWAKVHVTWGLSIDALELARRAQALDPAWPPPRELVASIESDLAGDGGHR